MSEEDIGIEHHHHEIDDTEAYSILGVDLMTVFRIFVAIGIFVASIFTRRIISQSFMKLLDLVSTPQAIKDWAKHILAIPLSFATVFAGFYFAGKILELPENIDEIFQKVGESVVNMAVFWLAFQIIDPLAKFWMDTSSGKHEFAEEIKEILTKIVKALIIAFGFLAVMEVWGINVSAFLAGLGLMGMAVALAAQDTVKNLFGSLVIIIDKIFHKGHFITSSAVTGTVEHFGIRVTQIRKLDTSLVFVPNATLSNGVITNISAAKRREISWTPQLAGSLSQEVIERVMEETRHYLEHHDKVENDEAHPLVHVSDVSDGTVTLMIYFHVKMMPLPEHFQVREQISFKFREIVQKNHASFALPTRSVYLREQ
jgi:MscS family membrane protein